MFNYRLGFAFVSAALIAGGLYFYEPPKAPPKETVPQVVEDEKPRGVGIIDVEQITAKHPDGVLLDELREREIQLRFELKEAMRPIIPPKIPEVDTKPFDDSAREKIMQEFMSKISDLKAKEIILIEKYRAETEPEYLKRRNEVRDIYFNEAMNITLKLQNAKSLYLSAEEYQALQDRFAEITAERNVKQNEVREEWVKSINDKVKAEISAEQEKLRAEYEAAYKLAEEDAAQRIREVEARNQALLDSAREMEYMRTRRQELYDELIATTKKANELESKIFSAITVEVGKIAATLKLQMVFVQNDEDIRDDKYSLPKFKNTANFRPTSNTIIFAGGGITDLTNDVIKSMKLKGILTD